MKSNEVAQYATHRSLLRALSILDAFSIETPDLRLFDLVRRTGQEKSTLSRLVKVLEDAGFLRRTPDNGFTLSLKFLSFAEAAKAAFDISRAAEPILRDLRDRSRGTVALRLLEGDELVTTALLESPEPMRVSHPLGGRTPYNFGSYGKAVLAFAEGDELELRLKRAPLHAFTAHTITDARLLKKALVEVRRNGYAFSDQEGLVGARAVAAPVWNHESRVIGALGVSFPKDALALRSVPQCGALVKGAARQLSAVLGAQLLPGSRTGKRR